MFSSVSVKSDQSKGEPPKFCEKKPHLPKGILCVLHYSVALAKFSTVVCIGAFPLHGTVRFGMARYGTTQFGSVCVSTAV